MPMPCVVMVLERYLCGVVAFDEFRCRGSVLTRSFSRSRADWPRWRFGEPADFLGQTDPRRRTSLSLSLTSRQTRSRRASREHSPTHRPLVEPLASSHDATTARKRSRRFPSPRPLTATPRGGR